MKSWPSLTGRTFGEVLLQFQGAVVLGIKTAEFGDVLLNPEDDTEIQEGDEIIVLAEDDDTYSPLDRPITPSNVGLYPDWKPHRCRERVRVTLQKYELYVCLVL